jgi:hypothetical protein
VNHGVNAIVICVFHALFTPYNEAKANLLSEHVGLTIEEAFKRAKVREKIQGGKPLSVTVE